MVFMGKYFDGTIKSQWFILGENKCIFNHCALLTYLWIIDKCIRGALLCIFPEMSVINCQIIPTKVVKIQPIPRQIHYYMTKVLKGTNEGGKGLERLHVWSFLQILILFSWRLFSLQRTLVTAVFGMPAEAEENDRPINDWTKQTVFPRRSYSKSSTRNCRNWNT